MCVYTHTHTHTPHFDYPFTDGHMSGFYLLATVNNSAKSICIQISLQDLALSSLGFMS